MPAERVTTWPDGTLKERWFADEKEQKHGIHEQWTEAGVRTVRTVYVHGRRTGEHREWRPDSTPICIETWLNDVLHGTAQTFHPSGRVASSGDRSAAGGHPTRSGSTPRLCRIAFRNCRMRGRRTSFSSIARLPGKSTSSSPISSVSNP